MGSPSNKPGKQRITAYYMALQYGLCHGLCNIWGLDLNDKTAWRDWVPVQDFNGEVAFDIDKRQLFGGEKKQGGIWGRIFLQSGSYFQKLSNLLSNRENPQVDNPMYTDATKVPNYRGIATMTFDRGYGGRGFEWGSNTASIPSPKIYLTSIFSDWFGRTATIGPISEGTRMTRKEYCICVDATSTLVKDDGSSAMANVKLALKELLPIIYESRYWSSKIWVRLQINVEYGNDTRSIYMGLLGGETANSQAIYNIFNNFVDGLPDKSNVVLTNSQYVPIIDRIRDFIPRDGSLENPDVDRRSVIVIQGNQSSNLQIHTGSSYGFRTNKLANFLTVRRIFTNNPKNNSERLVTSGLDNTLHESYGRITDGYYDDVAGAIMENLKGGHFAQMNPAHIIYQVLTNKDWGMGTDSSKIDDASFRYAAQYLYNENFGLSLLWSKQSTVEDFIDTILAHIDGVLYVDRETNTYHLKLIRPDYDANQIEFFNDDNSSVTNHNKRSPGETINEVIVNWVDKYKANQQKTVTAQSLSGFEISDGEPISTSLNFPGVSTEELAWRVARRELASESALIRTVSLEANKSASYLTPGDPFKLTNLKHHIDEGIFRVISIKYGEPQDETVRIEAIEDVFSLNQVDLEPPQEDLSGELHLPPTRIDNIIGISAPYQLAKTYQPEYDSDNVLQLNFAATPNVDAIEYLFNDGGSILTDPGFRPNWLERDFVGFQSQGANLNFGEEKSKAVLTPENLNYPPFEKGYVLIVPHIDNLTNAMINSWYLERAGEFCYIETYDVTTNEYTLVRGLWDTVPRAWVKPDYYFFRLDDDLIGTDGPIRNYSQRQYVRMVTSLGESAIDADDFNLVYLPNDRAIRPARPANVSVNGGDETYEINLNSNFNVAWSNRNRLSEEPLFLPWQESSVTPEENQRTLLEYYDAALYIANYPGNVEQVPFYTSDHAGEQAIVNFDFIRGLSRDNNVSVPSPNEYHVLMKVRSVRNSVKSWNGQEFLLKLAVN